MRPIGPFAVILAILLAGCLGTTADLSGSDDGTGTGLPEGVQVYGVLG